jgi:hypothetical protein
MDVFKGSGIVEEGYRWRPRLSVLLDRLLEGEPKMNMFPGSE